MFLKSNSLFFNYKGFQYQGFCWYLGDAGDTCDVTCTNHGATNEAEAAGNIITDDDCTVILHFNSTQDLGLASYRGTSYTSFGYYYTDDVSDYFCTESTGSFGGIGSRSGETNPRNTRRLVCACTGN